MNPIISVRSSETISSHHHRQTSQTTDVDHRMLRIDQVTHRKKRSIEHTSFSSAICDSIRQACKYGRFADPQVLPATMQEISIKKELANDMKKSVNNRIDWLSSVDSCLFVCRVRRMSICWIITCCSGKNRRWAGENYVKKDIFKPSFLKHLQLCNV